MVTPKSSDKLMKHIMRLDRNKPKSYISSEQSEFFALDWDIKKGITLPPHKKQKYEELKAKLGK